MQTLNSLTDERLTFRIDLSQSSIIEIVDAYVKFKKTSNAEYKSLSIKSNPKWKLCTSHTGRGIFLLEKNNSEIDPSVYI